MRLLACRFRVFPGAWRTGPVFQSSRRRKNSLGASHAGQISGGSSPSWMYPQMTHSHRFIQEKILPEGTARRQNVHLAGNGVGYGDRMRLPGGWDTALPATSGSTYPASGMIMGGGRPSSIISALRMASSRERAGVIPILSTSSGRREETRITLHAFALESVACAVCPYIL